MKRAIRTGMIVPLLAGIACCCTRRELLRQRLAVQLQRYPYRHGAYQHNSPY